MHHDGRYAISVVLAVVLSLACVGVAFANVAAPNDAYAPSKHFSPLLSALAAQTPAETGEKFSEGGINYEVVSYTVKDESGQDHEIKAAQVGWGTKPKLLDRGDALVNPDQQEVAIPATVTYGGVSYPVTSIASYAFHNMAMRTLTLPEGLTSIGLSAFQFCRSLESLAIPASVTSIGSLSFFACNSLAEVTFAPESSIASIGDGAFAIKTTSGSFQNSDESASLTQVTLPASLVTLGSYAFYGQSALTTVTFEGDEITAITPYSFGYCTSLERIDIPTITSTIERIGRFAFYNDTSLKVVTMRGGLSGRQVTQAGNEFSGCTGIETVVYYDKRWNSSNEGGGNSNAFQNGFSFGGAAFANSPKANVYYTIKQYASKEDAEAGINCLGEIQVLEGTSLLSVTTGNLSRATRTVEVTENDVTTQVQVTADEVYAQEGYEPGAWKYEGDALLSTYVSDSLYAYACDPSDLGNATIVLSGADAADEDTGEAICTLVGEEANTGVVVYDAAGVKLEPGVDYAVSYRSASGATQSSAPAVPGSYTVVVSGQSSYSGSCELSFSVVAFTSTWARLSGDTAYDTVQRIVKAGYASTSCTWAVVAPSASDQLGVALSASALAGSLNAAVFLADAGELSEQMAYEIQRVGASHVVVVGDASAVSNEAYTKLQKIYGVQEVYRISAESAAETAAKVVALGSDAAIGAAWSDTCVVVAQSDIATVASVASYAYATSSPVFMGSVTGGLSEDTLAAITSGGFARVVVVDGAQRLPEAVDLQLRAAGVGNITHIGGSTPTEVSLAVADFALDEDALEVAGDKTVEFSLYGMGLISSANSAEAIAASALCGKSCSIMLDVDDEQAVYDFLAAHKYEIAQGYFIGDESAVSADYAARVQAIWN